LDEMSRAAEHDEHIDRLIDEMQRDEAAKMRDSIVEGRLSAFFVRDADLKVWLKAPTDVRARRIANREHISYEEALSAMKRRERSEVERYKKYYGINPNDLLRPRYRFLKIHSRRDCFHNHSRLSTAAATST